MIRFTRHRYYTKEYDMRDIDAVLLGGTLGIVALYLLSFFLGI